MPISMARRDKVPTDPRAVGALLRLLRQRQQISVSEMAKQLRRSRGYISGVENGHESVSPAILEGYAQVLGIEPDRLAAAIEAARRVPQTKPAFGYGLSLRDEVPEAASQGLSLETVQWQLQELHQQLAALGLALEQTQSLLILLTDGGREPP
jgi:transcriptional regulator with XRE-family HTH domain